MSRPEEGDSTPGVLGGFAPVADSEYLYQNGATGKLPMRWNGAHSTMSPCLLQESASTIESDEAAHDHR